MESHIAALRRKLPVDSRAGLVAGADRTAVVVELEHAAADTLATLTGAVADALGRGMESGAGLVAACARVLEVEPHLLVLDDGDRVTAAAAELVRALLVRVSDLVVLATGLTPVSVATVTPHRWGDGSR